MRAAGPAAVRARAESAGPRERKKPSEKDKDETETVVAQRQESYVSFAASLSVRLQQKLSARKLRNVSRAHFGVQGSCRPPCRRRA